MPRANSGVPEITGSECCVRAPLLATPQSWNCITLNLAEVEVEDLPEDCVASNDRPTMGVTVSS